MTVINGPSFQSAYDLIISLCNAITAFLLLIQFRHSRTPSFLCLACGYLVSGVLAALHVLTIPGVLIVSNVIDAAPNSAPVMRAFWLLAQPIGALAYVAAERWHPGPVADPRRAIRIGLAGVLGISIGVLLAATALVGNMPDLTDRIGNWWTTYAVMLPVLLAIQVAALLMVFLPARGGTVLSLWLTVSLLSGLTETVISWWLPGIGLVTERRYSLLFYVARTAGALATSLLLLALLHQMSVLCARLSAAVQSLETSERRLIEQQRRDAIAQLAGGVAHDFNNILTVVTGNLGLLRGTLRDARQYRMLDAAARAADRGGRLTRHILTFARRQMLRPAMHDLHDLLDEGQDLIQSAAGGRISLVRDFQATWSVCSIDRTEFELAVLNIVVNAQQAMTGGGTLVIHTVEAWVTASSRPEGVDVRLPSGRYLCVSFSDSGPGMPPDVVRHAFEPFFTTKEVGQGSGLGLSQVHGFAGQSGGDVTLSSTQGRGTTVSLYLPALAAATQRQAPAPAAATRGVRATVVVVEDTADVRDAIVEMLTDRGCRVFCAENAREGLALIEEHCETVDILLTDIVMPGGMSGVALVDEALRCCPNLSVLLMTGDAGGLDAANDPWVLRKPFSEAELMAGIQHALGQRRGERRA
ncbi:MAG: MASE4 domain-containing protein [Acetobacteraceae bacterium]